MGRPDTVEIYEGDNLIHRIQSSIVPRAGELLNLRKQTYRVIDVNYAIDYADQPFESQMVAAVNVTRKLG